MRYHDGAVREGARDESAGGNSFGPVSAIDAFSRVGDSLECPPQHVNDLLVSESLKFIDEVCGEVAVERAGSPPVIFFAVLQEGRWPPGPA